MERRHFLGCVGGVAAVAGGAQAGQTPPPKPTPAQTGCRITVLKRSLQTDMVERFGYQGVKACERFSDGQAFTLTQPWSPPEGFCPWAWADIRTYVSANFHGGRFPSVACCSDGLRPVFFRVEPIEAKG